MTAGQYGLTPASFTASPAGQAAVAHAAGLPAAAGVPAVSTYPGAGIPGAQPGGKARSSMNLGLISGR